MVHVFWTPDSSEEPTLNGADLNRGERIKKILGANVM